jgi:NADH-quinone oxidoreductase subunit L
MTAPLIVLAVLSVVGGFGFFAGSFVTIPHEAEVVVLVPVLAVTAAIVGAGIAIAVYRNRSADPLELEFVRRAFYIDNLYGWLIDATQEMLARIASFIDRWIIDVGAVRGVSGGTWSFGALLRLFQVGNLQAYAFLFGLAIVALIYFTIFR